MAKRMTKKDFQEHHSGMGKVCARIAEAHGDAADACDDEAMKKVHRRLEACYKEAGDMHGDMEKKLGDEIETNGDSFGSRDFKAAAGSDDDEEDITDLLRKVSEKLGNKIVPDGVFGIIPTDNLKLVGRPGAPTVDVSDSSIDSEFAKAFSLD